MFSYRCATFLFFFLGIFFFTLCVDFLSAEKILVLPIMGRGSQYIMAESMTRGLMERGHEVTYLLGDDFNQLFNKDDNGTKIAPKVEFHSSGRTSHGLSFVELQKEAFELSLASKIVETISTLMLYVPEVLMDDCKHFLYDEELIQKFKETDFDIIVTNFASPCSLFLGGRLSKPNVVFFTGTYVGTMLQNNNLPTNPSYVPSLSTKMTPESLIHFSARLQNFLVTNAFNELLNFFMVRVHDQLKTDASGSVYDSIANSEVVLVNGDFAFEYPRPIMPITPSVGGITVNPMKQLSKELDDFVNSADEGVIVVSFGSYLTLNDKEQCQTMADAFARLPQKVVWKLPKDLFDNVSDNVMVIDWLPQNDLLGHPKTKALVYHGGQNGIFEAIYHAVPIVGIPFYGDQFDNLIKLKYRGMGIYVDFSNLTSDVLYEAIHTVLNEKSFKENAVRLSAIHRDQPLPPADRAAFWIETVMRYGGQDLKSNQTLNIIQYFCLDVLLFFETITWLFLIIIPKIYLFKSCLVSLKN